MTANDQRIVDICTAAVVRVGTPEPEARVIALTTVADALDQRGRAMAESAERAPINQYHKERRAAGEIILRARALLDEAKRLQEAQ